MIPFNLATTSFIPSARQQKFSSVRLSLFSNSSSLTMKDLTKVSFISSGNKCLSSKILNNIDVFLKSELAAICSSSSICSSFNTSSLFSRVRNSSLSITSSEDLLKRPKRTVTTLLIFSLL